MAQSAIDRILREYEELRYEAVRERDFYVEKIHEKFPQIAEIEKKINTYGIKYTGEILKNPEKGEEIIEKMEEELKNLKSERSSVLEKFNVPEDYNEIKYRCDKCSDTGFVGNEKCSCLTEKLREEGYKVSNLGNLIKKQNFENFNFSYYSKEKNANGFSSYDYIKLAYDNALKFCENLEDSKNLLFYGSSGIGKTFLSSCIAKEVIDKGFEVRFLGAAKLFSYFDDYKFNRGDEEENKRVIDNAYSCDLLIIDDLGTEFFTQNSLSFLYDLMNERIISNKKMIINTNLSIDEMTKKYTPRFISRLYESFITIKIEGENIRKQL